MSSDNYQNQVTEASAIGQELSLALKSDKIVIPFSEKRLPYGWSAGSQQTAFFDLNNCQSIEEYCPDDQVITVQCGIKLHVLEQFLLKNKQCLPFAYPDEQTSLLDLILTGNAGPTETFAGGLRRHILGLTFILSNGHIAKSGGKVVKNVSGYDLTRFLIGSYGYFALPIKASLRLCSAPEQTTTMCVYSKDIGTLFESSKSVIERGISLLYIDLLDKRLLGEELAELVMNESTMTVEKNYCLLARIYGDQNAVAVETAMVQELLNGAGLEHAIFTEVDGQNKLLSALTRIDPCLSFNTKYPHIKYPHIVELALSGSDFIDICQNQNFSSFPFLYRIGSGKLSYYLNSSNDQDNLLALLNKYAKEKNMALTVAYSNDVYMKKVDTIGTDTTNGADVIKSIKDRLKEQFDPHNLFNPFVDL
jgi:FAD/FMN-containing dehydrogenase